MADKSEKKSCKAITLHSKIKMVKLYDGALQADID
jgi:hypothetical protein